MACHRLSAGLSLAVLVTVAAAEGRQAGSGDVKPAFDELVVRLEPTFLDPFGEAEQLQVEADGRCWYRAEGRKARPNVPARTGAVFDHVLSGDRIRRLNKLLQETRWLTAEGGKGPATHTDAATIRLTLRRQGERGSVVCHGHRPEPYASLLRELEGLAIQERRVYLHGWVSGRAGAEAWQEIGHELDALRGGPYSKSPFPIDYERYLPIAKRIVRSFYDKNDDELIPAVRLIGHFKAGSELAFLHRMAHDRSSGLRREVAWALGRIHDRKSLPVLVSMMSAQGTRWDVGFELIKWGDEAVPHIVKLISLSTDERLEESERLMGEDMIRAYLDNWGKLVRPIDPRVMAEVRKSLESKPLQNSMISTTYHREFLKKIAD